MMDFRMETRWPVSKTGWLVIRGAAPAEGFDLVDALRKECWETNTRFPFSGKSLGLPCETASRTGKHGAFSLRVTDSILAHSQPHVNAKIPHFLFYCFI